ncbi:hypothetical protein [Clostridium botulinum]|uniref:hypothetical protein n=2 Tax=Clostridium botulinum TaxID=1491 RepID=UPI001E45E0EE|nr:hypothetical protein [Clostridium botulinum]
MRKVEPPKTLEFEGNADIIKNNNSNILEKNLQDISKNNIRHFNKSNANILKENNKNMMNKYNSCINKKNTKLLKYIRELNINKSYIKNLKNIRQFNINKKNLKLILRNNCHDGAIKRAKSISRVLDYSLLKDIKQKNLFINRKLNINKTVLKFIKRKNNLKLLCKIKVGRSIDIKQKLDMYKFKPVYFLDIKRDKNGNLINMAYFIDTRQNKNLAINKNTKLIEFNKTINLAKFKNLKTTVRFNKHTALKIKFNLLNKRTNNNLSKIKIDKFIYRNKLKNISLNNKNKLVTKCKNNNILKALKLKLVKKHKKIYAAKENYIFVKNTTHRKLIKQDNFTIKKYTHINVLKNNSLKLFIKSNAFKINKSNILKNLIKPDCLNINKSGYKSLVFNKNIYINKANFELLLEKNTKYFNKKNIQILDKKTSINIAKNKIYFSNKYEKNIYKFKDNYSLNKYPIWINKNNPGYMLNKYPISILKIDSRQLNNPYFKNIRIERSNKFLEIIKRWWVLSASGPYDAKILPDDYSYFDNPIEIKNFITNKFELLHYHPISYMPYLQDRKGIDLSYGTDEIDLSIEIMIEMVNIVGMIIGHNSSDFKHCSGQEAIEFVIELILDWFNLDSTKQTMLQKGSYEHYLRAYRWIRWESEKVWFIANNDKSLFKGYDYLKILFKELTEYLRLHHFNEVPLWRNLRCMDIERNFNRQALNGDLLKELDKNKGYRHYSIDNQQF